MSLLCSRVPLTIIFTIKNTCGLSDLKNVSSKNGYFYTVNLDRLSKHRFLFGLSPIIWNRLTFSYKSISLSKKSPLIS